MDLDTVSKPGKNSSNSFHSEDQETLTTEDLMVIAICSMLDVWQQQFEL
jgi:hypothetical protein